MLPIKAIEASFWDHHLIPAHRCVLYHVITLGLN